MPYTRRKLCNGHYHNCKYFEKRMKDESQALLDEQNRLFQMEEESRKKRINDSRYVISDIPDNLKDKYVNVEKILRYVKGNNLKMYEELLDYFNNTNTKLITKE